VKHSNGINGNGIMKSANGSSNGHAHNGKIQEERHSNGHSNGIHSKNE